MSICYCKRILNIYSQDNSLYSCFLIRKSLLNNQRKEKKEEIGAIFMEAIVKTK
ncbi:MAG: hypothetical protein JWQ40_2630 [Segetibacter sp.]|nr:hypothetical protein [Segetibacter sp.]